MFNETTYNLGDLGYTYSELVSLAQNAGCSPTNAAKAAAVAMAESSGNPNAHNPKPPDDSYGLWQINMLGKLGPARRSQFGLSSNQQLLDAQTNARAMAAVSGGCQNFNPWTTFTSGAYKKFLQAVGITPAGSSGDSGSVAAPSPDAITEILDTGFLSGIPTIALVGVGLLAAYFFLK